MGRLPRVVEVDPAELRLPPSRQAADPLKLHVQMAKYGDDLTGMPPPEVTLGADGEMMINDGVTRATRAAKWQPGVRIRVLVVEERPAVSLTVLPKVRERI